MCSLRRDREPILATAGAPMRPGECRIRRSSYRAPTANSQRSIRSIATSTTAVREAADDSGQAVFSHWGGCAFVRGSSVCAAVLGERVSAAEAEQGWDGAAAVSEAGCGDGASDQDAALRPGVHDCGCSTDLAGGVEGGSAGAPRAGRGGGRCWGSGRRGRGDGTRTTRAPGDPGDAFATGWAFGRRS